MTRVDLSTSISHLRLKNPTMLASGILGEDERSLLSIIGGGAGAVVTKSIGKLPRPGHDNPTVVELETGLLNAMGLPNPGIDAVEEVVRGTKAGGAVTIGSIFGTTAREYASLAEDMVRFGADAVELNLSCPHVKGTGAELGSNPTNVREISREVRGKVNVPVFVKLTPNVTDLVELAEAAQDGGASGVVLINTLRGMAIDIYSGRPILANMVGGYSGRGIKPVGVRAVYEVYEETKVPIIGVGGIERGEDALEYIMAGARAVQIGSAVHSRGAEVFSKICSEMAEFMKAEGYGTIRELIGRAHRR